MFGRNGRLGLIVPANNSTLEPEIWPVLPPETAAFSTRILARGALTPEAVGRMETNVERAAEELAATVVDVIAYADMVTSFIMDPEWSDRRSSELSAQAGVPVYTCWMALRAALKALDLRSPALGTPYPGTIHENCPAFFEQNGYRIVSNATLDIVEMTAVPKVRPEEVWSLIRSMDLREADAIVLLATDLPTFSVIEEIEAETGLPVLTSNQTLLWHGLRLCGNNADVPGLGRVFREIGER